MQSEPKFIQQAIGVFGAALTGVTGGEQGRSIFDRQVGQEGTEPCSSPLPPPLAAC